MPAKPELRSTRYFAWLYSPAPQRLVLEALFGIEGEIAGSLRPGLDHHVAHSRLQWWREECERCANGRPVHPMTRELVAAFDGTSAPANPPPLVGLPGSPLPQLAGLSGLVDTAVWDLAGATFETRRELTAYCERWAGAMIEPIAVRAVTNGWRALGAALREVEMLTDLAREAHSGRLRVPLDELERAEVDPGEVAKPPWPPALAALLRERHETLRATVRLSLEGLSSEEQLALRGVLVWAALTWRLSWRAQRNLPNTGRPRRFDAIADGWFAWRAAHRATAGRYRLG